MQVGQTLPSAIEVMALNEKLHVGAVVPHSNALVFGMRCVRCLIPGITFLGPPRDPKYDPTIRCLLPLRKGQLN